MENKPNIICDYVYNSCGANLLFSVKIAYHCFSCDKNIPDIETAEEHSKSLSHEVNEMFSYLWQQLNTPRCS
jgi:hypothetical protein